MRERDECAARIVQHDAREHPARERQQALPADAVDFTQVWVVFEKIARAVAAHAGSGAAIRKRLERGARQRQRPDVRQFVAGKRNRPSGAAAGARTLAAVRSMKAETPGHGECSNIVMPITGTSFERTGKRGIRAETAPLPRPGNCDAIRPHVRTGYLRSAPATRT